MSYTVQHIPTGMTVSVRATSSGLAAHKAACDMAGIPQSGATTLAQHERDLGREPGSLIREWRVVS